MIVVPVNYTSPDGAERNLRFSQGAKRRLYARFGQGKRLDDILKENGDSAVVELAYFMMFDKEGNPPSDLTLSAFFESLAPQEMTELMACVISAMSQAQAPKNEIEALLKMATDEILTAEIQRIAGSGSGVSPRSASESAIEISGGTPTKSSTPVSIATKSRKPRARA